MTWNEFFNFIIAMSNLMLVIITFRNGKNKK